MAIEEAHSEVERVTEAARVLFGIEIDVIGEVSNGKFCSLRIKLTGPDSSELHCFITPGLPDPMTVRHQVRDFILDSAYRSHNRRHMPGPIQAAIDDLNRKAGS